MSARRAGAEQVDVLVVGAGPAGLAAAATLGRYGISTLLVERRVEPSSLPRATALSTRSAELVRSWGLESAVRAGGVDAELRLWESRTLAEARAGQAHVVGYPSRAEAALVSPTHPIVVPQDHVERVLRAHVARLPKVQVRSGWDVVDLDPRAGGVRATVRRGSGRTRPVTAQYVVAADGAHSAIRTGLGIGVTEWVGAYGGVQVVFRAPLWSGLPEPRFALYSVTAPAGPGLFLPAGPDDRWVYGPGLPPDHPDHPGEDPQQLLNWIRTGAGHPALEVQIDRIGAFHAPGEVAERFRIGNVFLVGDAAFRVTPRGGTGLNSALQSGFDLGWKLAWALRGWADDELLDTYDQERRLVAEHNLTRSTDPDGSRRPVGSELAVDLGGRIAHMWLDRRPAPTSTLDLLGPGWTLFTTAQAAAWRGAAALVPAPVAVRPLDLIAARALGVRGTGAVLTRPDGVPVALWSNSAGADELASVTRRFSRSRSTVAA